MKQTSRSTFASLFSFLYYVNLFSIILQWTELNWTNGVCVESLWPLTSSYVWYKLWYGHNEFILFACLPQRGQDVSQFKTKIFAEQLNTYYPEINPINNGWYAKYKCISNGIIICKITISLYMIFFPQRSAPVKYGIFLIKKDRSRSFTREGVVIIRKFIDDFVA